MNEKYRRVVKHGFTPKQLNEIALQNQWVLFTLFPETEHNPYELIYLNTAQDTAIHYIEDTFLQLSYILIRGDQAKKVLQQVESLIPIYPEYEIVELLEKSQTVEDQVLSLYYAAVTASDSFYEYYFERFRTALQSTEVELRHAALIGIGYIGWIEFKPLIQQLLNSESVSDLRHNAQLLLEGFASRWEN